MKCRGPAINIDPDGLLLLARRATREEILRAFRYCRQPGIRFESLSYEKNSTGLR